MCVSLIKKSRGIILISVMWIMLILMLILGYAFALSRETVMSSHQYEKRLQTLQSAESFLETLETGSLIGCFISALPDSFSHWQEKEWRASTLCHAEEKSLHYYYGVEFLEEDACAQLNQQSVSYYRVTLATFNRSIKVVLQSTIAVPMPSKKVCTQTPHSIRPGRQSWREV